LFFKRAPQKPVHRRESGDQKRLEQKGSSSSALLSGISSKLESRFRENEREKAIRVP
jgi:hypothetical protein